MEVWESFPKQTFRNRCTIKTPQGERLTLTVPVKHCESKQYTGDVEISYQTRWQHQHWYAIMSAYKHTPYFDYYADYIRPLYEQETRWLVDLNDKTASIAACLLKNQKPETKDEGQRTKDWSGQDLEQYWGDGLSILDALFRTGPETLI